MTYSQSTYITKIITCSMFIISVHTSCWGATPDRQKQLTASNKLVRASLHGSTDRVKQLKNEKETHIDRSSDQFGHTPLTAAVSRNHIHTAKELVEDGADIAAYNANGHNAVQLAAAIGNAPIVKMLIDEYRIQLARQSPGLMPDHTNLNNDTIDTQSTIITTAQRTLTDMINNTKNRHKQTENTKLFHAFIMSALHDNNLKRVDELDSEVVAILYEASKQGHYLQLKSSL